MRLPKDFFSRDVLEVAPGLLGKFLVLDNGLSPRRFLITESEAYRGEEDKACHASKGITARNSIMYNRGGYLYVYLIYGMYWMLNVVTGPAGHPQAVLIRGLKGFNGPGKLTRATGIDKSFHGTDLVNSPSIWIEEGTGNVQYTTAPRVGIDYADEYWKSLPWRFILQFA